MADLHFGSNSGDRRQYKTPKPYNYADAVRETATKDPGNAVGDTSRSVKPPKIATRGQGTQRNPTRGEETQGNLTRAKGTRENIIRGKPTRKKGAPEKDATRKGTAETGRSGRGDNGANVDPDLVPNLVPNIDPNLDHNLDPNLQNFGAPTGNLLYSAAPNANDEPGLPQGTDWPDPEDREGGNRPFNNPNYDDDGIIEDPPISENENEHDNGEYRADNNHWEQPFERPMMTQKVISSQSRGITRNYDETLQFQDDGVWVPAVYHESIRLDLIHKASLKGKYVHERASSTTPGDITSYLESHRTWGFERGSQYGPGYHKGNWPPILYQLRKPGNFSKANYPEAEYWKYNGKIVLSVHDSIPLRKLECLPDTISSKVSGVELEAFYRSDPRVETRDIKGRMPMYNITETGKRILSFTASTFSMRTHRFRAKTALLVWRERAGSNTTNEIILNYLKKHEPRAFQVGDVEGIGPIPKELEEAILDSNKKNPSVTNRAGRKYALDDKPRPKAAPAPTTRLKDDRSRSPHPPGQPPAASRPPRARPRIRDLPPAAATQSSGQQQQQQQQQPPAFGPAREGAPPQRPEQQPPPEGSWMKNTHGRAPSESPEGQPPLKRLRTEKTQQRAPPRYPEQSLAPRRPVTRGHVNDATTTVLRPEQQKTSEQLPAASSVIPPDPPRIEARTKYVPPPRTRTRKGLRKNQATSPLTHRSDDERSRGEREQEEGPEPQNPVRRVQTRSQRAAPAQSVPPNAAEQQQQPLLAPSRWSRRVPGNNPPMNVPPQPQPEQQQQARNRPPPKRLPRKK